MIDKKQAEEIYNKVQMYEQHGPWWQLTDKEVEYYQWLYSQSQYDKLWQEREK